MRVLHVETKKRMTYRERLQRLFLLWRLDLMGEKTNGDLRPESTKFTFTVTLKK